MWNTYIFIWNINEKNYKKSVQGGCDRIDLANNPGDFNLS